MRTGAAAGHQGYFHEAVLYGSPAELLAVLVPFLTGGVAADEPTVVALGPANAALVRAALPADTPVAFVGGDDLYARPTTVIRHYRDMFAGYVAGGAAQIRVVGEIPPAEYGATWDWWARYESAINHAYDDFPLWSMCAYDTTVTPAAVLADVRRAHPRVARPDGVHEPLAEYEPPERFLAAPPPLPPDPAGPPAVDLTDPLPVTARHAVRELASGVLGPDACDELQVAVSEAVTNGMLYGSAPRRLRAWRSGAEVVVTVSDGGPGPADPYAGLLPVAGRAVGGRGLWIIHQACAHVAAERTADGWTLRLTGR